METLTITAARFNQIGQAERRALAQADASAYYCETAGDYLIQVPTEKAEALRRALKAALRREPTPRELRRAVQAWAGQG